MSDVIKEPEKPPLTPEQERELEIEEPEKPTLTPEQEMELEIEEQDDAVQIQARAVNDPFQNILYISVQSKKLNKKVVTHFDYIEEMEGDRIVGRSMQGGEKETLDFNTEISTTVPKVIKQRPIERG